MKQYIQDEWSYWKKVQENLERCASERKLTSQENNELGFATGFVSGVNKATRSMTNSAKIRYFTSAQPFYTLVQAQSEEEAGRLVDELFPEFETNEGTAKPVTPRPQDFTEVSEMHATIKYALTTNTDGVLDGLYEVLQELIGVDSRVLLAEYFEAAEDEKTQLN